jgi:hypothetical protein
MRSISLVHGVSVALVLAIALAACDGPTRPTPDVGPAPPSPVPGATLQRLQIDGPTTVAPGQSVTFTATGLYSDGSTRNFTSDPGITWRTSSSQILAISPSGLATGGDRGEASITAMFGGRSAVKGGVLVLPPGTYRLAGTVTDNTVPLSGVRVEVTQGPATGMVALASPEYRLYGVSGDTEIRVTKDGYRDERRRIQVASHARADVELIPSAPRENVEGTYTLTVTASAECSALLPESARVRTFTAVLRQEGPRVSATLEGASFVSYGSQTYNSFRGTLAGDGLAFYIVEGNFYELPGVAELLTPPIYFFMGGSVATTVTGRNRSGTLDGTIGVGEDNPFIFKVLASCESNTHRFELARR